MRNIQKLMEGWTFVDMQGNRQQLDLPHTWNGLDGQDGGNDYLRGTCYYEKTFAGPVLQEEECVYLQFHGVNASAKVWINGREVMNHHNGYATFRADITDFLQEENRLKVEVDNSINTKVYPQKADFTFYGGIYRDVELLILNRVHFDLDYYGGSGLQIRTQMDTLSLKKEAQVQVHAYTNADAEEMIAQQIKVLWQLLDHTGNEVSQAEGEGALLQVENPHLWNGRKDPYLYTLRARLVKDGQVVDQVEKNIGIRSFLLDPDKGFYLNGQPYPLRGVSRHQDYKTIGNAISREQMEQDMELIKEVGANTIRLAHYQHDQYFYDLCDRAGMVVWAEIPYISAHMPEGRENTFSQIRELIVQNHHHPSIVTWGVSNEITISGKHRKDMLDNHYALQKLCKEMDPDRPTTLACYACCSPFHPVSKITDLVGWNLYLGWYVPGLWLNDLFMKFYHWKYPQRCLGYSEYGAEGMPNLHSAHPRRGDHTEEYQAIYHEYMLKCFDRHSFLWSTYVWNMFDFAADARNQGGEPGMNHKGLVTFDRQIKKDSFYLYKAWWSDDPFVHLSGKRYEYRTGNCLKLTVYSNQEEVSIYQNGKLMETQRGTRVFRFKLPMEEHNLIEVAAGTCRDEAAFYHTTQPRPEYKVKKGKSQNWV